MGRPRLRSRKTGFSAPKVANPPARPSGGPLSREDRAAATLLRTVNMAGSQAKARSDLRLHPSIP